MDDSELWEEYVVRKQTYAEIGAAHGVSAKTVQRIGTCAAMKHYI